MSRITIYTQKWGGSPIGYVEGDYIEDRSGDEIGKLSHGTIYTILGGTYSRKIGTYDRNYWYDLSDRPVVQYKMSLLFGNSYEFLKTSAASKFESELFR